MSACAGTSRDGQGQQLFEQREGLAELELALLQAGAHVAVCAIAQRGPEAVIGQPVVLAGPRVLREAGAASYWADRAERGRLIPGEDADVDEPVLEGGVEDQIAPARGRLCAEPCENRASALPFAVVELESAAADVNAVE